MLCALFFAHTNSMTYYHMSIGEKSLAVYSQQRPEDAVDDFMLQHKEEFSEQGITYEHILPSVCQILSTDAVGSVEFIPCSGVPSPILTSIDFSELSTEITTIHIREGYNIDFYVAIICLFSKCDGNEEKTTYISNKIIDNLATISHSYNNIYNIKIGAISRNEIIGYIKAKKTQGKFTVIDVGGSYVGWSAHIVDAIVDINIHTKKLDTILYFHSDITHSDGWVDILEYVKIHGKFDYSICTHTLEDIINPGYVTEQLSKISKSGYIATPSKYIEMSRYVDAIDGAYRGYIHHRYIFTFDNYTYTAYPKINYIEHDPIYDTIASSHWSIMDLSFHWREQIRVKYVNDNYLGPTVASVVQYYKRLVVEDDCDRIVNKFMRMRYEESDIDTTTSMTSTSRHVGWVYEAVS